MCAEYECLECRYCENNLIPKDKKCPKCGSENLTFWFGEEGEHNDE